MEMKKHVTAAQTKNRVRPSRRDLLAKIALVGAVFPFGSLSWAASAQPNNTNNQAITDLVQEIIK